VGWLTVFKTPGFSAALSHSKVLVRRSEGGQEKGNPEGSNQEEGS
jgi:hypothetical protein